MKKSKTNIDPEDLLKDIDEVFSLINELEGIKNINNINGNSFYKKAKNLEEKIKEKYPEHLDIKK